MSLNITVTNPAMGDSRSMNWLRNPFGLERWAHGNLTYILPWEKADLPKDLWDVCNEWNYDKASLIDRPLFKRVVYAYWQVIRDLDAAYFWFNPASYQQFTQREPGYLGRRATLPAQWEHIDGVVRHPRDAETLIGVPMRHFARPWFEPGAETHYTLARYKTWFQELVEIADMLQDSQTEWYCSN